jgi:hypothetical protein
MLGWLETIGQDNWDSVAAVMRQRQAVNPPIAEVEKSVKYMLISSVVTCLSSNKLLLSRVVILVTPRE